VRYGLNNGAMGTVVAVLYGNDYQVGIESLPLAVVVDFPLYTGEAWDPAHPTWVPIPVNTSKDVQSGAVRKGWPLKPGWATVIHKSQGMSIGDGKPIERMRLVLDDSTFMESSFLGLLYVACSRVERDSNWVLADPGMDSTRVTYVNGHPQMAARRAEDQHLAAMNTATAARYAVLADRFEEMLGEVDSFAADGLRDAEDWAGQGTKGDSEEARKAAADKAAAELELPSERPLIANKEQRLLLAINLDCLLRHRRIHKARRLDPSVVLDPPPPVVRIIVQGTAGVGKTFVINSLTRLTERLFRDHDATFGVAAPLPLGTTTGDSHHPPPPPPPPPPKAPRAAAPTVHPSSTGGAALTPEEYARFLQKLCDDPKIGEPPTREPSVG